jgi:hypothetical protein
MKPILATHALALVLITCGGQKPEPEQPETPLEAAEVKRETTTTTQEAAEDAKEAVEEARDESPQPVADDP